MRNLFLMFVVACATAYGADWYVDNTAAGSNNGTSWANAWTAISEIGGLKVGDTVYFSGGPTNSSQTYSVPAGGWSPQAATYQTGQDSAHNGMVIITNSKAEFLIINPASGVTFSGYIGQAFDPMPQNPVRTQHMQFGVADGSSNWDASVYCNNAGRGNNLTFSYLDIPGHYRFIYMGNGLNYSATGLTVDHCYTNKLHPPPTTTNGQDDTFYLAGLGGNGFGSGASFHDNFIRSPCNGNQGTAIGDDVFKWGSNFDAYRNHVQIYRDNNYPFGIKYQHGDIFQNNASFVRIYGNWFENISESVYFHDNFGGPSRFSNIQFYNNVITQSFPSSIAGVSRGMDMEPQDNGGSKFSNVLIANNTWNVPALFVYRFCCAAGWSNVHVVNDLYWNCNDSSKSSWDSTASAEVMIDHTMIARSADFLSPSTSSHNFALANAAPEIGAGSNAAAATFKTDFTGATRISWEVGAYAAQGPAQPQRLHRKHRRNSP